MDAVADGDAEAVAVKVAAAVAGRCNDVDADVDASSDAGCNMLRLVVAMPDAADEEEWEAKAEYAEDEEAAAVSGTCPGMLAVTDAVVGFAGGAGNGSRLIVVVLGVAAAEAREAGMAYTELDPVSVMPSGPRTVAAAE